MPSGAAACVARGRKRGGDDCFQEEEPPHSARHGDSDDDFAASSRRCKPRTVCRHVEKRPSDPKSIIARIGFPQSVDEWKHVQDVVWENHRPLPRGWIRVWSRSEDCEYYMRISDHRRTFDLDDVMYGL